MGMLHYVRPGTKRRLLQGEHVNWIENRPRAAYIRSVCLSAPLWLTFAKIRYLSQQCAAMTATTGVPHSLDHIVPLNHPMVSGLTVPWNLRIVPHTVNAAKGNTWHPDQMELFE